MLLEKVANELLAVKNIDIKKQYGTNAHKFFYNFLQISKRGHNLYKRQTTTFRKIATMLNVPVAFIIRILNLERIKENANIKNY